MNDLILKTVTRGSSLVERSVILFLLVEKSRLRRVGSSPQPLLCCRATLPFLFCMFGGIQPRDHVCGSYVLPQHSVSSLSSALERKNAFMFQNKFHKQGRFLIFTPINSCKYFFKVLGYIFKNIFITENYNSTRIKTQAHVNRAGDSNLNFSVLEHRKKWFLLLRSRS